MKTKLTTSVTTPVKRPEAGSFNAQPVVKEQLKTSTPSSSFISRAAPQLGVLTGHSSNSALSRRASLFGSSPAYDLAGLALIKFVDRASDFRAIEGMMS